MRAVLKMPGRRLRGLLAIACFAVASAFVMQSAGWAAISNYALTRAFEKGTARIDPYHWDTKDVSWYRGHYYSVKAPLMPALTAPLYSVLKSVNAPHTAIDVVMRARNSGSWRWRPGASLRALYGPSRLRTYHVRWAIEKAAPVIWVLGLLGNVLPAVVLLLLVRRVAERFEPGYGTAAAITLGLGTLIMPFSTLYFSHVLSATLAFGAFAVLLAERDRAPRLWLLPVAGVLAGLAFTSEYPLALAGAVLGLYAISRVGRVKRGLAYAGGWLLGAAPLFAYNQWAFGSITHFSYANAIKRQGVSGHDLLGLNDSGFFGINLPSPRVVLELLFASKGLLVLTPVLALSLVGLVLLRRRGRRAEAYTIGGLALAYLIYNSGYWLPFGGGTPGPRFLIPILPFLAVALAVAYRRLPATTLALAVPSAIFMVAATITYPLISNNDVGFWSTLAGAANFENTVLSPLGAGHDWAAVAPVLAFVALAAIAGAGATGRLPRPRLDALPAVATLAGWALLAAAAPWLFGRNSAVGGNGGFAVLIGVGAGAGLVAVGVMALWRRLRVESNMRPDSAQTAAAMAQTSHWGGRKDAVVS